MRILCSFLLSILFCLCAHSSADEAFPGIDKYFKKQGISQKYSKKSFTNLEKLLIKYQSKNIVKDRYHPFIISEKAKEYWDVGLSLIENANRLQSKDEQMHTFFLVKRMIYTIISDEEVDKDASILEKLFMIKNLATTMPYTPEKLRAKKLGRFKARKEASNLIALENAFLAIDKYLSKRSLAKLSTNEVSELEISPKHPYWYQEHQLRQIENPWGRIENWVNSETTKYLNTEHGVSKKNNYDLNESRKVLFLKKIKNTATSPKVDAYDAYGIKWKVKWGNEVHSEPIANRLYVRLGGKFTDLLYANEPGKKGLTLILDIKKDDKKKSCDHIQTTKMLIKCLQQSTYEFDLKPYIYNTGKITKENYKDVLEFLPKTKLKKYKSKKLIGREFVTFKESLVEVKNKKIMNRGGAVANSKLGANYDRVGRGLLIFSMWIKNTDAKDDNSRGILLKNFNDERFSYLEFMHDMGASLGRLGRPASINDLHTGLKFAFVSKPSNKPINKKPPRRNRNQMGAIIFPQVFLYRPKAWSKTTFADGKWMARKIAKLKVEEIREAVSSVKWPDYIQEAMTYKLAIRRNELAEIFGESEHLDVKEIKPLNITLDLSNDQAINTIAKKYKIDANLIKKIKMAYNFPDYDHVVKDGEVTHCSKSLISNLLEKIHHPAGITRRFMRKYDDKPLRNCELKR